MDASSKSLSMLSILSDEDLEQDCHHDMDRIPVEMAHHDTIRLQNGKESVCEYLEESHYSKGGVIVQFINTNCAGSSSLIGGLRLGIMDVRMVPTFLSKWKSYLRLHGIKYLNRQMIDTHCPVGVGETLYPEDYGISFTMASLSTKGFQLNPCKRSEGPLFFCAYPGLVEPAVVNEDTNGIFDLAHVVNAYIHLLPTAGRRSSILRRIHAEAATGNEPDRDQGRKRRVETVPLVRAPYVSNRQVYLERSHKENEAKMQDKEDRIKTLEKELASAKAAAIPTPALPHRRERPQLWPVTDNVPPMPDS
jgi:hypothetical protein